MEPALLAEVLPGSALEPAPGPRACAITFLATRDGERSVVRTSGASLPPKRDLAREAGALRALDGKLAPRLLSSNPSFHVVEFVKGRTATAEEGVDALAELHSTDWRALGFAEGGRNDGSIEKHLARATRSLDDSMRRGKQVAGGKRKRKVRVLVEVGWWLRSRLPPLHDAVLCHGNALPGKVFTSSRGTTFIDWEHWTIGDPFVDLAWALIGEDEALFERYALATGRALGEPTYYVVFSLWRRAIELEALYVERLLGHDDPALDRLDDEVPALGARALAIARPL
ncbi:MAG: phosphotransferase [Actinomycetota bacterium]